MNTDSAVRAVVTFPLLDADDRQWIESIRAKHDPEAKRIAAHFTLVFPAVMPARATEAHLTRVAHSTEPIRFVLRRAAVAPDALGSGGHVFLIPEDGRDALAGLHDRLYDGVLQPHSRRNTTFTPHITVAAGTATRSASHDCRRAEREGHEHPRIDFRDRAGRGDAGRNPACRALSARRCCIM